MDERVTLRSHLDQSASQTLSGVGDTIAAIAAAMKPAGVLSPRGQAYAQFVRGPIFISYGRPAARDRTICRSSRRRAGVAVTPPDA